VCASLDDLGNESVDVARVARSGDAIVFHHLLTGPAPSLVDDVRTETYEVTLRFLTVPVCTPQPERVADGGDDFYRFPQWL
jgi:hypothetical protein